jgi:hypothetical protein
VHFLLPFGQNDDFVGREETLEALLGMLPPKTRLNDCQRIAIEGLGGVGKTQIALHAAYLIHNQDPDCSVFWVPAISQVSFENAYREIGGALHIPDIDKEKADIPVLLKKALEKSTSQWLLIIDNLDDPSLLTDQSSLQRHLPFNRQGSILFTTRNHEVVTRLDIPSKNIVKVRGITETDALKIFRNGLQEHQLRDNQSTVELLRHLAFLPLAIKQACAYLARTGETAADYLQYCRMSKKTEIQLLNMDFEDRYRYPNNANPITTTWLISFQHVAKLYPLAIRPLRHDRGLLTHSVAFRLRYNARSRKTV